jgi:hypothetical protein
MKGSNMTENKPGNGLQTVDRALAVDADESNAPRASSSVSRKTEALRYIGTAWAVLTAAEAEGDLYEIDPEVITIRTSVLASALIALVEAQKLLAEGSEGT